jgi:GT2 family glycosyltransferase
VVSIVVVNYNGASIIERFLESARSSDYAALEMLVVDNASTDDSVARLEAMEDVVVVASPSNLGFGRGCNLGAAQARGELLLFANPDVQLYPDAVSVMVDDLLKTPNAAVVCATLIEPGVQHGRERRVEDVASMAAAAMLVERAHFERIGGFDPEIFLYSEDTDLCFRTWLVGRRVLKAWNAMAVHELAGSGGGERFSAEQIKNGLYVHIKLRAWPAIVGYSCRMAVKTVVRGLRLRDPAVLGAWWSNLRRLPATLAKRRAIRDAAVPADKALLERLGAEHAYWERRSWRNRVLKGARRRLTEAVRSD